MRKQGTPPTNQSICYASIKIEKDTWITYATEWEKLPNGFIKRDLFLNTLIQNTSKVVPPHPPLFSKGEKDMETKGSLHRIANIHLLQRFLHS